MLSQTTGLRPARLRSLGVFNALLRRVGRGFRLPQGNSTRIRRPGLAHALAALAIAGLGVPWLVAAAPARESKPSAPAMPGPTVAEVVDFTRIVQPRNADPDQLLSQVSPDGSRVFIVTRQANRQADRNRYRILLLDIRGHRLAAGSHAEPEVVVDFESPLDNDSAHPALQEARWADDRTLVFRGRVTSRVFQVYKLDLRKRGLVQLTHAPHGVVSYALSADQRRVVYAAPYPNPARAPDARSVVVGNRSFWSVKFGQNDFRAQQRRYQFFVADTVGRKVPRALGEPFAEANKAVPSVSLSPDGRWALLPRFEAERQLAWAEQYPPVAEATRRFGPALVVDPLSYFSRPNGYVSRRLVAYRLADGREQVVVDAPDDSQPGAGQFRTDRLWMRGKRSVVIGGSYLPAAEAAARGVPPGDRSAAYLIEYWPDTGRWTVIARLSGQLSAMHPVRGGRDAFVAVDAGVRRSFERSAEGPWRESVPAPQAPQASAGAASTSHGWTLRIAEGLNVPPDLVADGPDGQRVRLTHLNPQYGPSWGTMRPYTWTDARGRPWEGGLMVPAGFAGGRGHPLVIQTYGFSPDRFYLDGANAYDGFTSGFPGRAFLRESILVLALPVRASRDWPEGHADRLPAFADGVRGAIAALVAEGLVDRERVGIMGWSATGERVLNLLTFSDVAIRSASILDGDANTLFSMAVTYAASDSIQARKEETNQGTPFGASLDRWVRSDPALHTDCIRAALRIESYGPWVLNNWDIYALMRRQYKAVEMVLIPEGSHGLLTPSDRMVSLQGNVDWHRFWLTDGRRHGNGPSRMEAAALSDQYARWGQMSELKQADDSRPACLGRSARR